MAMMRYGIRGKEGSSEAVGGELREKYSVKGSILSSLPTRLKDLLEKRTWGFGMTKVP